MPLGLGAEIPSDNPATEVYPDATPVEVVSDALIERDTVFKCPGSSAKLKAAAGGLNYLWSTGESTREITISQAGTYWVEAQGACGSYLDTFAVVELPPLQVDLGQDLTLSFGTETTLQVQTTATHPAYFWQTDSLGLSCYTCPHPQFTAKNSGTVSVQIRDTFGCTAADSLHVTVLPERFVYFPTGISVNDDGINDYFLAYGKGNFAYSNFRIYNRWGDLVYEKKNGVLNEPTDGWDGRFNGKKAATGMYTFTITVHFAEGEKKRYKGKFYLIR